ncbi:MAG: uroporphyrinogen-III C-methyltransferase [Candidatus Methanomethylicaceae archaeon]
MKGKVYLVGAGVLGLENITLRAYNIISEADVVLYDRLVDEDLLKIAKKATKKIYVGKEPREAEKQRDIIDLMIKLAKEGFCVVRLKSGDPFIFGRGGEELLSLQEAGVDVEVIPGLTSAVALPTLAKIPLTMRGVSSSVVILSGSLANSEDEKEYLMKHAKFPGTLVLLMSIRKLPFVARNLIQGGADPETPAAIITSVKHSIGKKTYRLKELADGLSKEKGPGVVVIGRVVEVFGK